MSGYDIGASFAASSGAQGGPIRIGDFTIGGSGGVGKMPWYAWVIIAAIGGLLLLKLLFPSKR